MNTTPDFIDNLIAGHKDGTVSTLMLYGGLRTLASACQSLERERDELQRDKARLDWLEAREVIVSSAEEGADVFGHNAFLNEGHKLRAAIDAAMAAESKS